MPVKIRQIGPCFAGEVEGIDMRKPLTPERGRGHPCRHGQICRAGVPRSADRRRAAARLYPQPRRDRAGDRREPARAQRIPAAEHVCRRVEPRPGPQAVCARRPPPAVRDRQPPVALRQLVQGDAGQVLAAACAANIPSKGGNTEFADMRAAYDALDDETKEICENLVCEHSQIYSRAADRLFRPDRRGARALQAGAAGAGPHPPGDRPQVAVPRPRMPAASSAGRCRKRAVSCAT